MKNPNAPGSNRYIGGVYVLDPITKKPVSPGVTVQQVEGGFDPTGLSTEEKQDAILAALGTLTAAIQNGDLTEVTVTDDVLPPVEGQATATKQDAILGALNTLLTLASDAAAFRDNGTQAVSLDSAPLPVGAATAAKQDAIRTAVEALSSALSGTLNVAGTVSLSDEPIAVGGSVEVTNPDFAVKPVQGVTFPVSLAGMSTAEKQDAILAALGNVITALQAPQPITDNGGSITVDGNVGVSGAVQVEDNGKSLTVDGVVDAKQSGAWTVGINGPVTVQDADGGSLAANLTDASGNALASATAAPTGTERGLVVRNIPPATQAVTQSGTWTMNVQSSPSATSTALTPYRNTALSATPQQVKSGAGRVYQYNFHNPNNVPVFVHMWGVLSANVTPGTTVPLVSIGVPAGSVLDGYWNISPAAFASGLTVSASTSSAGTGAPNNGVFVQLGYV